MGLDGNQTPSLRNTSGARTPATTEAPWVQLTKGKPSECVVAFDKENVNNRHTQLIAQSVWCFLARS